MFSNPGLWTPAPERRKFNGFPETLENLAKSMVSRPRDLSVAHRFRGTFNWEPWILDGTPWKSLEEQTLPAVRIQCKENLETYTSD